MPPSISDPAAPPETPPNRRFLWPAEYYSGPTPNAVLPRWVSFGCGAAALVVILLVFAGGAWLSGGGFATFLDFTFGVTLGELRGMYTPDVTDAQKNALEEEIEAMRERVRTNKLPAQRAAAVLQRIQKAIGDDKVTAEEVRAITDAARAANQPQSRRVSQSQRPPAHSETLRL